MKRITNICLLILWATVQVFSQDNTKITTGRILDANGNAVSGATILLTNTNINSVSNAVGNFSIAYLQITDSVNVSHIGYHSVILTVSELLARGGMIVLQTDNTQMDAVEIVSTGYQNLPRERSTGSFELIGANRLNQQITTTILDRLESTSGLLFDRTGGAKPPITVRGLSSINSSNDPLIILNNFPYEGRLENINPNDIQSVTILKDAAAASIWGARAGNGVIVITTKNGAKRKGVKFELTSNTSFIQRPDLTYAPTMATEDFLHFERFLFDNRYRFADTASLNRPSFTPYYELLFREAKGEIAADEVAIAVQRWTRINQPEEYQRHMYRQGFNQQYALNMRGGAEKVDYFIGMGFDQNKSILDANYSRITVRNETNVHPTKNIDISFGLAYTGSKTRSGRTPFGTRPREYPYQQFRDENGVAIPAVFALRMPYIDTAGAGRLLDWNYYPATDYQHRYNQERLNEIVASTNLTYRVTNDLSVVARYQFQQQSAEDAQFFTEESYFTRDLINRFTVINPATGNLSYNVPVGAIRDLTTIRRTAHNGRAQLQYTKVAGLHQLNAIGGIEIRQIDNPTDRHRVYGYDMNMRTSANVDLASAKPNYFNGRQEFIPGNYFSSEVRNRFISQFFNASYRWKSRYTLTASARRDASNLFGVSINEKWQPLWSFGGMWNIDSEKWFNVPAISQLKVRTTVGYSGNINQNQTAVSTITYSASNSLYTGFPSAFIRNHANPQLRWERVRMWNTAVDFSLRNVKLGGSLEYYRKKSIDLFGPAPIDPTTGLAVASLTRNVAAMTGRGFELQLNSTLVDRKIKVETNLILNHNITTVDDYFLSGSGGWYYVSTGEAVTPRIGQPVFSVISYKWGGLDDQGNPTGFINRQRSTDYSALTGSGTTINDLVYEGSATPTWWGSILPAIQWKSWELNAAIGFKLGYFFKRPSISYFLTAFNYNGHSDYSDRWQKPGDETITHVPAPSYPLNSARDDFYLNSEIHTRRGDHARLQYLNLAYTFTKNNNAGNLFDQLQLFVNAANLGIIWRANNDKIDPDKFQLNAILEPGRISVGIRASW